MKKHIFPLFAFVALPIFIVGVSVFVDRVEIAGSEDYEPYGVVTSDKLFRDNTEVYKLDENDEVYSKEVLDIYNPAVVNVIQRWVDSDLVEVEVDISGDRQERNSLYVTNENLLSYVRKETIIYQFPKWDEKHAPDISTTEVLELDFDLEGELKELRKDGLPFECGTLDLCANEVDKAKHDFEVYQGLKD